MTQRICRLFFCLFVSAVAFGIFRSPAPLAAQTADPTPAPIPTPAPVVPYRAIGDAYAAAGDSAKALEYYLKALEEDPADAAALDAVRRVLSDQPNDLNLSLADAYAAAGDSAKALEYYLKALETDPTDDAALDAVRGLLKAPPDDPRLKLAEAYAAAGNHEAALEIYTELLAVEGVDDSIRDAAVESAKQTHWLPVLTRSAEATAGGKIVNFLLDLLGAALIIILLLLLVRLIRRWRGRDLSSKRIIVVQPFRDGTGVVAGLAGMEQGAREMVIAWLVADSKVSNDRPIKVAGKDEIVDTKDDVSAEPFPDVGTLGTMLNWVWKKTAPPRPMLVVDGTLLYRAGDNKGDKKVGLALSVRERPGGPIIRNWRAYALAPAGGEFARIEELSAQGASWVRKPGLTLSPTGAMQVYELNQRLLLAQAQDDAGDTVAARQTATADPNVRPAAAPDGGLAGEAGQPAAESGYSDALTVHREGQLKAFLGSIGAGAP